MTTTSFSRKDMGAVSYPISRRPRWRSVLIGIALLLYAPASATAGMLPLNSGRSVDILTVGPLVSTKGWSALALKYRTEIPLTDVPALRDETDEIWNRFVIDAEKRGYDQAIIMAAGPESGGGIITSSKQYSFIYRKIDGLWRTTEWATAADARLDANFIRTFIARLDRAYQHRNPNTMMLYFAPNWTMDVQDGTAAQSIDLSGLVQYLRAYFAKAKDLQYRREILAITIDPGGATATVESRETEAFVIDGRRTETIGHVTDRLAVQDTYAVLLETHSRLEKKSETAAD